MSLKGAYLAVFQIYKDAPVTRAGNRSTLSCHRL